MAQHPAPAAAQRPAGAGHPRLGLDHGWVKRYHGVPGQYLSGASAGLNLSWKQVQLDLDYQRSLSAPAAFRHEPESWLLRLSLQI